MSRSYGSQPAFVWPLAAALACLPMRGLAQDDEEVILDPELEEGGRGGRGQDEDGPKSSLPGIPDWGDLDEAGDEEGPGPRISEEDEHDPQANTGTARIEAIGQFGADMHHEGALEDAYETRMRLDTEVEFRRSRKLRLSIGVRTDLLWAVPSGNDSELDIYEGEPPEVVGRQTPFEQDRFELDLIPLSGYIDVTPTPGFHLRIGSQQVSMARMDVYSPIDMLAALDLRIAQPASASASVRLAQPAVRMDWDLGSWATLQATYVPWFMPHLGRPNRDRYVADVLGTRGPRAPLEFDDFIDPSFQTKLTEELVRFVGPAPDFTKPQAQARLNMRGPTFEVAISGGTALEKLASMYATPTAERVMLAYEIPEDEEERRRQEEAFSQALLFTNRGYQLADIEHHRYYQVGLDGSFDVAPITIGFELAYSPSRHWYTATRDGYEIGADGVRQPAMPRPNATELIRDPNLETDDPGNVTDASIRKGVPVIQGAVHLEWLYGESFALLGEAFWVNALQLPYDTTRDWWGMIPKTGAYVGGVIGAMYQPTERLRLEGSMVGSVGPSFLFTAQAELKAYEGFYVNVGMQVFEGAKPTPRAADLNLGGMLGGWDQVYLGVRYLP